MNLEHFIRGYKVCALWSSTDVDQPMDLNHDVNDIAPPTATKMEEDCRKFCEQNAEHLKPEHLKRASFEPGSTWEDYAGHDFWLTRCGHGAGFWDGDWISPAAEALTNSSNKFGNVDLYVGDDRQVWS
jgi:hypothetical protein